MTGLVEGMLLQCRRERVEVHLCERGGEFEETKRIEVTLPYTGRDCLGSLQSHHRSRDLALSAC